MLPPALLQSSKRKRHATHCTISAGRQRLTATPLLLRIDALSVLDSVANTRHARQHPSYVERDNEEPCNHERRNVKAPARVATRYLFDSFGFSLVSIFSLPFFARYTLCSNLSDSLSIFYPPLTSLLPLFLCLSLSIFLSLRLFLSLLLAARCEIGTQSPKTFYLPRLSARLVSLLRRLVYICTLARNTRGSAVTYRLFSRDTCGRGVLVSPFSIAPVTTIAS